MAPDPRAARLIAALAARGLTAASCESLTGGLVGAVLTGVPGASAAYRGGLITYASDLKASLVGVDAEWIGAHGVINAETAQMMAVGCARVCGAAIGLACTGVAGPESQDGEPVGTVFICASGPAGARPVRLDLSGDRGEIRRQTVEAVLRAGLELVSALP